MSETNQNSNVENQEISNTFYEGSEPVFGTFMQAQVSLNAIRLTLDDQVVYSLFELAADIETTRRVFLHTGSVVTALHDLRRIENGFEAKVSSWEGDVTERNRNKRGKTGAEIAKMKSEVARVRAKINLTRRTATKLKVELHHIDSHNPDLEKPDHDEKPKADLNPGLAALLETSFSAGILHGFVGTGKSLSYHTAKRMVVGQLGAREIAWDPKLSVMMIVGWYPVIAKHVKADHFQIRVWLVPKSATALSDLLKDYDQFRLAVRVAGSLPVDLNWKVVDCDGELAPQSHSLQPFVQRIKSERFDPTGEPMKLLCATSKETFWKNASTQLCFRVV